MKRQRVDEAIAVLDKRFGYFPRAFLWHGHRYEVEAVERCWTRPHRHYFRVRCAEGVFELYQDVRINAWRLAHREPHPVPRRGPIAPAWR